MARVGGLDRRSQTGPAGADHRDAARRGVAVGTTDRQRPRRWVRVAIHSLRSGVSEMRWCSTWKPSRLDLAQQGAVDVGHHQAGLLRRAVLLGQQRERLVVDARARARPGTASAPVKRSL